MTTENDRKVPPLPATLPRQQAPDTRLYAEALSEAAEVQTLTDRFGVPYAWLLLPGRNTWPTWHENRPAPTPGCRCAPCARPRCCDAWAEPVTLNTGETVAWVCPTCIEAVIPPEQTTPCPEVCGQVCAELGCAAVQTFSPGKRTDD